MQAIDVSGIEQNGESTAISASADDPAVIFYTSGSSGSPKGIMLKHEGLRNWIEPTARSFNLGREVVLQQTSPTFDLSLIQVFAALCFGGSLCLTSRQQRGDAEAISKIVADQGVTFTGATPTEYATWLHYGKRNIHGSAAWKTALCAGEPVPCSLVEQLASLGRPDLTVYNVYGPTETSFTCTATQVSLNTSCGPIAAGRPLPNYSVYVVDGQLRPVPVGMQGEIYIGGPGVGLGYLNKPELTSARFVPNVLDKPKDDARGWKTLHRTGDLGRWLGDGQLLVEGRIDTQVKLRGLRIDLAEVEHAILDVVDGELCEAVVSVRRSPLDELEFLVAHIVFAQANNEKQHLGTIRLRLSKRLPKYMCPAAFISLEKMPTTTSGKLDRKLIAELPLPSDGNRLGDGEAKEQVVTLTDTETRLKEIWEEILGLRRRITVQADFFHVGGSSLLLLSLKARIRETFNCDMPLVRMFESSTLGAMAHQIDHGLSSDVEADAIDWDKETALPHELLDFDIETAHSSTYTSPNRNAKPKVVVLTGATGQLGRALLDALVSERLIDHVHCIGVRNTRDRSDMAALDKGRVTMHAGDLVLPDLGLSEDDAAAVFGAADVVIHNGADLSYLKTYASLRAANLQSTKDLAKMIARHSGGRSVPFHYVSTVSVGNIVAAALANGASDALDIERGGFVFHPVSVAAHPPPSVVSSSEIARTAHGYVATKWASEVFLEHLHGRHPEWPVVVHRPSLIARRTPEASGQSKEEAGGARLEFVENLRRYSSLLRAVPVAPAIADKRASVGGAFDVVPLSDVVKEMVDSLRGSLTDIGEKTVVEGVKFFHHIGGVELPLDDVRNLVAKNEHGKDIREMDVVEWTREAGELGMHPTMVALFESLAAAEGRLVFPRLAK
jgi:amino acid adenylation domain-containing protein